MIGICPACDYSARDSKPQISLSQTQKEIILLILEGVRPSEIAKLKGWTRSGIKKRMGVLYAKLGIDCSRFYAHVKLAMEFSNPITRELLR